jgi:ribosomal protein S18 acetylase RimI-like enzyme
MLQIRPARLADLPAMAAVLQDAFSGKMRAIFGNNRQKVVGLLEAIYTGPVRRGYDGVLVADRSGRIVGTLIIEPLLHTADENRAFESLAVRELGLPRMLRAAFMLWLLSHKPEPDEAYISDVGVATDCQGEGIGGQLLAYAEQWAHTHGRTRLTLWVAADNARAVHVYEKAGLAITRTRSSWLTRLTYGIRHWHFMEKSLTGRQPAGGERAERRKDAEKN